LFNSKLNGRKLGFNTPLRAGRATTYIDSLTGHCFYFDKLRLSIKDVCTQGGGGLSSTNVLQRMGVFRFRCMSELFGAKKFGFFEVYGCSHGQGRFNQCEHFPDKEEKLSFSRFCADVFFGQPLKCIAFMNSI